MKKSYLFYLWQYMKSVALITSTLFVIAAIRDREYSIIVGVILSTSAAAILLFCIPIILSSLVRYLVPKHIYLSGVISLTLFLGWGFIIFGTSRYNYGGITFMFCCSLLVPILSEFFISLSLKRAQKKQSIKENQE